MAGATRSLRDLYEMPAGSWAHSKVIMNLIKLLLPILSAMRGELVTAPTDVFFPGANPVQPDILALLPGSRAIGKGRGVEGPPDLVIEVLSPSSRGHDLLTKRALYARAGVREYWIVDPMLRSVDVLALDREGFQTSDTGAGGGQVASPLLGSIPFALEAIFAGLDESAD
jgi:Uma2 family endonuclease